MSWIGVGLLAAGILAAQGISTLMRQDRTPEVRFFGALTLLLAGLGLVACGPLFVGRLVLSPELGTVMVEGSLARFALAVGIAGGCVAGGLGWHVARLGAGWASRLPWLLGVGAGVGVVAATRLLPFNPDDAATLRVYAYDLWWPVPLIWLSVCVVDTALIVLRAGSTLWRWWAATILISAIGFRALARPTLVDPTSRALWLAALVGSGLSALGLTVTCARRAILAHREGTLHAPSLKRPTLRQSILLTGLTLVSLSVIFPFVFYLNVDTALLLAMFIIGWTLIAELTEGGPLQKLAQTIVTAEVPHARVLLAEWWRQVRARLTGWAQGLGAHLKGLVSPGSWPAALLRVIALVVALVVLSEIPNSGKTIIEPFNASRPTGPDKVGRAFSDRLFHDLGLLDQQLQPSVVTPEGGAGKIRYVTMGVGTEMTNAALGEMKDIAVAGVHIPLTLLVAPVQGPMHALLNVRVITGNVEADRRSYTVLASASTGMTWTASVPRDGSKVADTSAADDAATDLAERLAFKIISTDRRFTPLGMTTSWDAFQAFREGLEAWSDFKARNEADAQTYDGLTRAIARFQEATKQDPAFALAHYRLGVALEDDGQPMAAAQAFRAALSADPHFVAGYNALAYHLFFFDDYYYATAAALPPKAPSTEVARQARRDEARALWQRAILLAEGDAQTKASAYYGLCRYALEARQFGAAYFYCTRAGKIYAELSREVLSALRGRDAEASALNALGVALELSDALHEDSVAEDEWSCQAREVAASGTVKRATITHSWYAATALPYYRRAIALQPNDLTVQCNAASTAYVLGDTHPMRALESLAAAHRTLADGYRESAKGAGSDTVASASYRLALEQYQRAIELDPADVVSLNGYAYAFWSWRLGWPASREPTTAMAESAEAHARSAVTLTATQRSALEAIVRSTLGEVLLAEARPHEAIVELRYILDHNLAPKHASYDELRWDLAEADLCAAHNDEDARLTDSRHIQAMKMEAGELLEGIRHNEEPREFRPFSNAPRRLDPAHTQLACQRRFALQSVGDSAETWFRLLEGRPHYSAYKICRWLGVLGDAYDGSLEPLDSLWLHVWGSGVDGRIRVGDAPRDAIFLSYTPRNSHGEYLARLENAAGGPASGAYEIATFANDRPDRCPRNQIELTFIRER